VEAQFSTVIYEAFQNAVENPNLLQVIIISFFFPNPLYVITYKSSAGDHRMLQLFCQCSYCSALSVRPAVRAHHPRTHFRSAPEFCLRLVVRAQRLDPFARRVWFTPEAVRAHDRFRLRSQLFRLAPSMLPWTATSYYQPPRRQATVRKVTAVK
jgi:hypothetical protein